MQTAITMKGLKPALRRQQSLQNHRAHFDTIIRGSLPNIRSLLEEAGGPLLKDLGKRRDLGLEMLMTNFAHGMQRKVDRFVHTSVESAWSEIDTDGDGTLDKSEMKKLVDSLFGSLHASMPALVRESVQPAMDDLHEWLHSDAFGPTGFGHNSGGVHKWMESQRMAAIEKQCNALSGTFALLIDALRISSQQISDELFSMLDANKDNRVSKEEFSEGFAEGMGQVLDFSRMVRMILKEKHESLTESHSGLPLDGMQSAIWGLGFATLMAGLLYTSVQRMKHK
eukprot:TRINITY_DN27257_c0_g1_i3.p1 TRINITY_DN27257_c0_g1~~TRINITY_DN27257_c0_g1_i3.p1  ORF type:complete len:282 (+),score=64.76 TRINITY_DN27257_c0_g1_i3:90-935(+)